MMHSVLSTTTPADAARLVLQRRNARRSFGAYVTFTKPKHKHSFFSDTVCAALDQFIADVEAGLRPILVFQAPPQHGKSELVSRILQPYLMGSRPDWNLGMASYADTLARSMLQHVRMNLEGQRHLELFPLSAEKRKYAVNNADEVSNPWGSGSLRVGGVGSGFTGRPFHILTIDDPTKDAAEALSAATKTSHQNWWQSVVITRMDEYSGIILMATSWAEDDLPGWVMTEYKNSKELRILKFPALNYPGENGYNPLLPEGPLVPALKSEAFLRERKARMSSYWYSCLYQQTPESASGAIFKKHGVQYIRRADLPQSFDEIVDSWDCTFKDTDGSDYVVGQKWGRKGPNAYLLAQIREHMGFSRTVAEVVGLRNLRMPNAVLVEDKANGPAVINVLQSKVPGLLPVEPDGSKAARAHACTSWWEAHNVYLPSPDECPWIIEYVDEVTRFTGIEGATTHDDQVDATTQALRHLFRGTGVMNITDDILALFGRSR